MLIAFLATVVPILIAVCFVKILDAIDELNEFKRQQEAHDEIIWILRDGTECRRSDDEKKRVRPRDKRR